MLSSIDRFPLSRVALVPVLVGLAAVAAGLSGCSAGTSTSAATVDQLDGTTWCSPQTHTRVSVDRLGAVSTKEGKDLCLAFTGQDGSYVVRIVWWNLSKGIHVEEWAVALPVDDTHLDYVEADHPRQPDFPGIMGQGQIVMDSDTEMSVTQLGHLVDGSAGGFRTTLEKVESMPEISIPLTYPEL